MADEDNNKDGVDTGRMPEDVTDSQTPPAGADSPKPSSGGSPKPTSGGKSPTGTTSQGGSKEFSPNSQRRSSATGGSQSTSQGGGSKEFSPNSQRRNSATGGSQKERRNSGAVRKGSSPMIKAPSGRRESFQKSGGRRLSELKAVSGIETQSSSLPKFWLCPVIPNDKERAMSNTAPEIIECEAPDDGLVILGRNPLTGVKDGLLSRETLSVEVKSLPDENASDEDLKKGVVELRPLKFPNKCMQNGTVSFKSGMDEWHLGVGDEFSLYMDKYRFKIVYETLEKLDMNLKSTINYTEKYVEPVRKSSSSSKRNSRSSGSDSSRRKSGQVAPSNSELPHLSFWQRVALEARLPSSHDHISYLTWGVFFLVFFLLIGVLIIAGIAVSKEEKKGPKIANRLLGGYLRGSWDSDFQNEYE